MKQFRLSSVINIPFYITAFCIFVPIFQVLLGHNLNRVVLAASIGIYLICFKLPKTKPIILVISVILIGFIIFGMLMQKGFIFSAFSAPLIYGIIFYFYLKRTNNLSDEFYYTHLSSIYKLLIILMIAETIIASFDPWIIFNALKSSEVEGYRRLGSKLARIMNLPFRISGINSVYLGPQIFSMICLSGIVWFFPYNKKTYKKKNIKWLVISMLLFI